MTLSPNRTDRLDPPGTYRQGIPPDPENIAVLCWIEQKVDIARDLETTDTVMLRRSPNSPPGFDVYERVDPHSPEAQRNRDAADTQRLG